MGAKCYLVVDTGERTSEPCQCRPGCEEVVEKRIYQRLDTGEKSTTRPWNNPPGAMWFDDHHDYRECFFWENCDGKHLNMVTPSGGIWDADSRASNCTMPNDKTHRCWVRHGEPPNVTVDKAGKTCSAGAGSIISREYHGFLRNGQFT